MDSSLISTCPSGLDWNSVAGKSVAGALMFGGLTGQGVDSFITFISQQSTYNWYFKLTQFETIFLCILMFHAFVLRWLEILPINVNNWVNSEPSGRRRRRRSLESLEMLELLDKNELAAPMLAILRKLDDQECLLKALCLMQSETLKGHSYPEDTKALLRILTKSGRRRAVVKCDQEQYGKIVPSAGRTTWKFLDFETAVLDGFKDFESSRNSTACSTIYSSCDTPAADIIDYVDMIASLDFL